MRLTGMLVGMKEVYPQLENCRVTYLDGDGNLGPSFEAMRKHLRTSKSRRLLVGAINDPSALGALRAFQEAGRSDACAVMGQNAAPEGRAELSSSALFQALAALWMSMAVEAASMGESCAGAAMQLRAGTIARSA